MPITPFSITSSVADGLPASTRAFTALGDGLWDYVPIYGWVNGPARRRRPHSQISSRTDSKFTPQESGQQMIKLIPGISPKGAQLEVHLLSPFKTPNLLSLEPHLFLKTASLCNSFHLSTMSM